MAFKDPEFPADETSIDDEGVEEVEWRRAADTSGSRHVLFDSTIEQEDYAMGERIQVAAESGELDTVVFGRNEPALHHYHNSYRAALGLEPLAEHRAAG